jgi:6-pyruvoyltetrahydropterin/6-carboxytetrahydropterin synthase
LEIQRVYKKSFEMAHTIKDHPKCGNVHGHSYNLILYLDGSEEVWVDFADIKKNVDFIIDTVYDHRYHENMSAEKLAHDIGEALFLEYKYTGKLELFETSKYGVTYEFPTNRET